MENVLRLLATFLCLSTSVSQAASLILSDFDNTLVETRKIRSGSFVTAFRLFPVSERSHALERVPPGADPLSQPYVEVTPADFDELKHFLSGADREVDNRNRLVTLQDGSQLRPGEYQLRYPETFYRFLQAPSGSNYLLEDLQQALRQSRSAEWKGPYWDHMVKILANPKTADTFRIITARGHTASEWDQFFQHVKEKIHPEIHLPPSQYFHNVSRPEFDQFNLRRNVAEAKFQIVKRIVESLAKLPVGENDLRLNADGTGYARLHYVALVEDSQENLEPIAQYFQTVARAKRIPIKLGVFNMGLSSEISKSGRKQYSIVRSDGTFRSATEEEILGDPHAGTAPLGEAGCASEVLKAAQGTD